MHVMMTRAIDAQEASGAAIGGCGDEADEDEDRLG